MSKVKKSNDKVNVSGHIQTLYANIYILSTKTAIGWLFYMILDILSWLLKRTSHISY